MRATTIGEAAQRAGVGVETIRFYERRGLIKRPPKPQGSGFRVYSDADIRRVKFVREAQRIGFSLNEIRELLALRTDPNADCANVQQQARIKLEEVEGKIGGLMQMKAALETLIAACPGRGNTKSCTILDALSERGSALAENAARTAPPRSLGRRPAPRSRRTA